MRHLCQSMHPRIGATGGGNPVGAGFQPRQGRFNRSLNRGLIGLRLPSGKGRAMVFDLKGISGHAPHIEEF
jgi:hypothetical protein